MPKVYYAVLKHAEKRKKEERITHLLILPNAENDFLYLGVPGKVTDEPGSYVTQLIVRFPQHLLNSILDGEAEQFGERYEVLEQIECSVSEGPDGCYSIHLNAPGRYIRSDLKISFKKELSAGSQETYFVTAALRL